MILESMNSEEKSYMEKINQYGADTAKILESLVSLGYESVDSDTFVMEVLGENNEEIKQIALNLNNQIREISMGEYKKIAAPIMMKVIAVNNDGTISINKPTDRDDNDCWTEVYNPTIFNHLEVGDEVLVGYYEGGQKSNCWIMFAKTKDFKNRTILKDINDINNKIKDYDNKLKNLEKEIFDMKQLIKDE